MPGDFAHAVHAAGEYRSGKRAAGEAVDPSLHGLLRAVEGRAPTLRRRRQQIRLGECVIGAEKRVSAVKHGLELAADAIVVNGRCKHQHIRIAHLGGNFHGIVLDDAVPQLQAGKAALAEAELPFAQTHGLNAATRLSRAVGESVRQRLGIAILSRT